MESASAPTYWITRLLFQRALGFIYLIAFLVTANQGRALIGEQGLLPIPLFLKRIHFWDAPSLFWLHSSDRALLAVAGIGVFLAVLAVTGVSERFGIVVSALVWFLLWVLYLSFVNVGQTFYSFGWETMLLEAGFLAIFLGSNDTRPPVVVIWMYRWMLFRLMFGAGLIKLRGDACWRDLTCMFYHYETQPIPNPLSWHLHQLPPLVHKAGTALTHFIEIAMPWLYFFPRRIGIIGGLSAVLFQVMLILSGNLSWLNYLTIAIAIPCFDDAFLSKFIPIAAPAAVPMGDVRKGVIAVLALLVAALSVRPAANLVSRLQLMNASFEPLHLVNTYGAFGSITKERTEIIIEGTEEAVILPDTKWRAYEFKAKPGDPHRPPPVIAPYHLRLDWLMWFAAMSDWRRHPWFLNLVAKLLQGDEKTLKLLDKDPFPGAPPRTIRAVLYLYRFTTPEEKRRTGDWWHREPVAIYLPPVSLQNSEFTSLLKRAGWL